MTVFTYSQARQNLATLLEISYKEGEVLIKRKDGSFFCVKPSKSRKSPLDVDSINSKITTKEIVSFIRESRER